MNKQRFFLAVGVAIVAAFLPVSLFSFSVGSISIYEKVTPPDSGLGSACVVMEKTTGFPFGVLKFYSPGCPPDLSVRFHIFGFVLDVLVFASVIQALAKRVGGKI